MRLLVLPTALLVGLAGTPVLAQPAPPLTPQGVPPLTPQGVPPGTSPLSGARPGNDVGTGMSLPMGSRASNIDRQDTRAVVAPNLPSPEVGDDAPINAYLRAAEGALASGRTGEAQQSLEMAQTRLLDRSVPTRQADVPSQNPTVQQISEALRALAAGDRAGCMNLIQAAMATMSASRR
jgi:hypothetical protein